MSEMWIYVVFLSLLSEAWSIDTVIRHSAFNLGSNVDLSCSEKTWTETIFVTWSIKLKSGDCMIGHNSDGRNDDTCNDGKSLRNTSSAQSYLHIPSFSENDVGLYKCESIYNGGGECYEIHVAITVEPNLSAWLEPKDSKMVAVCRAENGKPAANISWSHAGNSTPVESSSESNGFYTVESRLELPEGTDPTNVSCAVSHLFWRENQIRVPKPISGYASWKVIITVTLMIVVLAVPALFFAQKKLMLRREQKSQSSPAKSPPAEDMEEVEPYASYVQRVNSIYNSSADLFT